ncbi:hypothetical protein CGJ89_25455, partial [Vibrio parahaemolyticus]
MFALVDQGEETEVATCDFYIVDLSRASSTISCHKLLNINASIAHFIQILDDDYLL